MKRKDFLLDELVKTLEERRSFTLNEKEQTNKQKPKTIMNFACFRDKENFTLAFAEIKKKYFSK